jgi:hypothetical protein
MVAMMKVGAPRPDMMMPDNSRRGKTGAAATMERRASAKTAAAEHGAATAEATAMNGSTAAAEATTVKATATPETATSAATKATASTATETAATMAVATPDFSRQSVRGVFRGRRGSGIDQRQSLGVLARRGREHQHRSCRKAQGTERAADSAAPRIWNLHHENLPE